VTSSSGDNRDYDDVGLKRGVSKTNFLGAMTFTFYFSDLL